MKLSPNLTPENIYHLKKGQEKMTVLLREFDRICRKYDIKYWCIGGTFIGAIRHKGWIPYDGDIDVGMLEQDYSKFKKYSNELPPHIWLQTKETDKMYKLQHIHKLRDLYSHYVNYTPNDCHRGLQLDIFTYQLKSDKLIMKQFSLSLDQVLKTNQVFPLKEAYFEDIMVYIPNNYEEFSIEQFGNYPPHIFPINKRKPREGNIISDKPHPKDLIDYKWLYTARGEMSSSHVEVVE